MAAVGKRGMHVAGGPDLHSSAACATSHGTYEVTILQRSRRRLTPALHEHRRARRQVEQLGAAAAPPA